MCLSPQVLFTSVSTVFVFICTLLLACLLSVQCSLLSVLSLPLSVLLSRQCTCWTAPNNSWRKSLINFYSVSPSEFLLMNCSDFNSFFFFNVYSIFLPCLGSQIYYQISTERPNNCPVLWKGLGKTIFILYWSNWDKHVTAVERTRASSVGG